MDAHQCLRVSAADGARLGPGAVALRYQSLGYAVLGLVPGGKQPHPAYGPVGGVHWATRDEAMVPWLWGQDRYAGIGIATGQLSGLVIVDLDRKHGHDGPEAFAGLNRAYNAAGYPPVPYDAVVSSPNGGWHIYLGTPRGWPVPTRKGILDGVDVLGDAAYVAAPPTRIRIAIESGDVLLPYEWAAGCPCSPPAAPEWFLNWISSAPPAGSPASGDGEGPAEALPDLSYIQAHGIAPGYRNITLHRYACQLFRHFTTGPTGVEAVHSRLDPVWSRSRDGFGRPEYEKLLRSARAFVRRSEEFDEAALDEMVKMVKAAGGPR